MEVNRENLCVILMDNGVVEDHLPNHVLSALQHCLDRHMCSHDREALRQERLKTEHLISNLRSVDHTDSQVGKMGFKFMAGSTPVKAPPGGGSLGGVDGGSSRKDLRMGRQTYLKKQRSFDDGGTGLQPPRNSGLGIISESADEDLSSSHLELVEMTDVGHNEVLVSAEVNESALCVEEGGRESSREAAAAAGEGEVLTPTPSEPDPQLLQDTTTPCRDHTHLKLNLTTKSESDDNAD